MSLISYMLAHIDLTAKGEGPFSPSKAKLGSYRTWQAGLLYIDVVDDDSGHSKINVITAPNHGHR